MIACLVLQLLHIVCSIRSVWQTKMIPRRSFHSSILQSWSVAKRSRNRMDKFLRTDMQIRFLHSSYIFSVRNSTFLCVLSNQLQTRDRALIWGQSTVKGMNFGSGNSGFGTAHTCIPLHRNSTAGYHRIDQRHLVTSKRIEQLQDSNFYRRLVVRETVLNAMFSSSPSSDESSKMQVDEPPAPSSSTQKDEKVDLQKPKAPEPLPISSYVVLQHWLEQLKSPPNLITASRIMIIPFISYWIITQQTLPAIVGCIYAAVSDVLDGYLARRYPHMQTALGTYLDPLGTSFRYRMPLQLNIL